MSSWSVCFPPSWITRPLAPKIPRRAFANELEQRLEVPDLGAARAGQSFVRSPPTGFADLAAKPVEIVRIGRAR